MVSGDLAPWAENMLLDWANNDPVSQKEIDRNNTIYGIQNNRNPFIDNPEWVNYIWGPVASINNYQAIDLNVWSYEGGVRVTSNFKLDGRIFIYNVIGELVYSGSISEQEKLIQFSNVKGLYIIKYMEENVIISKKVFLD